MNWIQSTFGKYFNAALFRNAFILWFLLLPFDSNVLPVSLGVMTVYPFLLLTFFLLGYSFLAQPQEVFSKMHKATILFFFFWLAYGLAYFPFVHDKKIAFYEIRSLILMATCIWLLFRARYLLGLRSFFELLHQLATFLFIVLTVAAFFEFFTGIHFQGFFTEKLWNLPSSLTTYSPVLLYDNPNTALCYLLGIAILIFLASPQSENSSWKNLTIIIILFFFSVMTDSKFGKISCYILTTAWLIGFAWTYKNRLEKKYLWWASATFLFITICIVSKPLYYGPLWKDSEHYVIPSITPVSIDYDRLYFYSQDSLVKRFGEQKVIKSFREYQMRGTDWGINIRKNLLRNGWYLFKQSKFLGVGPAQFMWYHAEKQVPYPTTTVTNPHNYVMEILSQYGLPVFIPFMLIFIFSWITAFKGIKNNIYYFYSFVICTFILFIISNMPSSFLILNIGWVLIAVSLLAPSQLEEKNA